MNAGDGLTPVLSDEEEAAVAAEAAAADGATADKELPEASVSLLAETGWRLDKLDEDGRAEVLSYGEVPES